MGVVAQRLDVELDEEIALEPEPDLRTAVEREAAALPQAAVGPEELGVALDDRVEVGAGDLLLALDDPANCQGRRAAGLAERPDRREPDGQLRLVVGRAAGEQPAVADGRLERRRLQSPSGSTGWTS